MKTIEERFGKWYDVLKEEFNKDYFKKLGAYVAQRRKVSEVFPVSDKVFRAFELTDPDKVLHVWIGCDPYPGWSTLLNAPIADGLAFSTSNDDRTPLSLFKIQKGIEDDCYEGFRLNKDNDLEFLAKRQNVLLLNSFLTIEKGASLSHQGIGWETFNKAVLQHLLDKSYPISFITFGVAARKLLDECKSQEHHLIINLEHPAASGYNNTEWKHQNAFSKANDFIEKYYGELLRIKWLL
jgi:uracil-DNA glycosylase